MKDQRLDQLEQYIVSNRSVTIDHLCDEFHISKNTVRRDLDTLLPRGRIIKVYGGAKAVENAPPVKIPLSGFAERHTANSQAKQYICRLAADFVKDGDVLYIDTGTTCIHLVEEIRHIHCTIITNSLQAAVLAAPYENLTVFMLPGKLKRETLSFVGVEATENLSIYNIDKAFMASTGVTLENGMTNASPEEYLIKKTVMEKSREKYLLVDHSKFGRSALHTYGSLGELKTLVTDQPVPENIKGFCSAHKIRVLY